MEPVIKSEPCEYIYSEQEMSHGHQQGLSEIQGCEVTIQQPQSLNNLKRCYGETKNRSSVGGGISQEQTNLRSQPFELPSLPHSVQTFLNNQELAKTMIERKPIKKYKRLEDNVLFNPPFFLLVEEILPPVSNHTIAARCYSCNKVVKGNRGISSNFIKHMKRSHPEIYKLYDGYKSNKIKSCQLPSLARMVRKSAPVIENGASGSDSTAPNSNDDTNQFLESGGANLPNDFSDDNDGSVTSTKEIVEANDQLQLSDKYLEDIAHMIDEKLKGFVRQKEYEQLNEKINSLAGSNMPPDQITVTSPTIAELKIELDSLKKECSDLRAAIQKTEVNKRQLQHELQTVDKVLYQRKLIIRNILVSDSENPIKSVEKLFRETMHLMDIKIVSCSIIPSLKMCTESKKETVSIELASAQDCKAIFRQSKLLKSTGIFIESEISPFQRKRKNKLMVLRKELLRRKPELKVLVRDTTLVVNGKKFYWDDVDGLCHDYSNPETMYLNGVEYLKSLCGLDLKEFTLVLQNYNVQVN